MIKFWGQRCKVEQIRIYALDIVNKKKLAQPFEMRKNTTQVKTEDPLMKDLTSTKNYF